MIWICQDCFATFWAQRLSGNKCLFRSKGLEKFKESNFDVVLCDFRLGDMDGVDILKEIKKINSDTVVIIITGYSDVKMAVEVMRLGAFDYITKPLIPEEVINVINNGLKGTTGTTNEQTKEKTRAAKVYFFYK
jgi:two-component system response regulator HydG